MVQTSESDSVLVKVGEKVAQEYEVNKTRRRNVEVTTCYIEAIEGEHFTVEVLLPNRNRLMRASLYVDGKSITSLTNNCKPEMRAFTFDKVPTKSRDSERDASVKKLDEACSIRVVVEQMKRSGRYNHTILNSTDNAFASTTHHVDSKAAQWGVTTTPGNLIVENNWTTCQCTTSVDRRVTKNVIIFKYLPRRWLIAKGLIGSSRKRTSSKREASEDDDDHKEPDKERMERAAIMKRAREKNAVLESERARGGADVISTQKSARKQSSVQNKVSVEGEVKVSDIRGSIKQNIDRTDDRELFPLFLRKVGDNTVLNSEEGEEEEAGGNGRRAKSV